MMPCSVERMKILLKLQFLACLISSLASICLFIVAVVVYIYTWPFFFVDNKTKTDFEKKGKGKRGSKKKNHIFVTFRYYPFEISEVYAFFSIPFVYSSKSLFNVFVTSNM